jgi:mannose-6-phosphate isomerase-like protein (cupin superfamily)
MNKRHWLDCPPSLTHGNIIQRVIFTKHDPEESHVEGAILQHVDSFARGYLEPGVTSLPHVNEGAQEVFFVAGGSGILTAGGKERTLREGDGVLIPPGIEHTFLNDDEIPLELLILLESIPRGTGVKNKTVLIRNYREGRLSQGHWHHLVHRIFGQEDGLMKLHAVLVVRMEPMTTADTHGHGPDMDEVWYMWRGSGVHVVGHEVCVQTPGTAVSVAPSDPGHSLINHTDEPLQAFYFAHYLQ